MNQSNRVADFLNVVSNSTKTDQTYRTGLKKFFQWVARTDKEIDLEREADLYFKQKRNYEEDILGFYISLKDSPPKTISTWLAVVKSFLIENDIELSQKFWRRIRRRMKSTRPVTEDSVPSNQQLRSILIHTTAKGKALFLMLASGGMRIGETMKLRLSDIDLNTKPTRIKIAGKFAKSGGWRYAFISDEATEALKEWLKVRDRGIKCARGRANHAPPKGKTAEVSGTEERIFPFTEENAYGMWYNALDKAQLNGKDEVTKWHKMHPHVLRKFFRSRMTTLVPLDIVEALMGHEGYLTEAYRRYSPEQLGEQYRKGESTVTVFGQTSEDLEKLRKQIVEDKEQLQRIVNGLTVENMALKSEMGTLKNTVDQVKGLYDAVVQMFGSERAPEELKLLVKANIDAVREYDETVELMEEEEEEMVDAWTR